ncbi:MAG TPA: 30S ribosomal protein S13 [Elusimicrobiales bacterium]|nr:30S ribosomal protein S13 [Elusimicrobiales bacterium]
MARIAGVDLPVNKKIIIALTYVYGIGPKIARNILKELGDQIKPSDKVKDLTKDQIGLINSLIQKDYMVEGELKREVSQNIHRYIEISSYRGLRHRRKLPARGQRTKTNARTNRGSRRTVGSGKAAKTGK